MGEFSYCRPPVIAERIVRPVQRHRNELSKMVSAAEIKAARALLNWGQRELAAATGLSVPTIKRVESSQGAIRSTYTTVLAIQKALEEAGIEFIDDGGFGVKKTD